MKYLPLSQDQTALIDDEDFATVGKFKWTAMKTRHGFYAYRKEGKKNVYLHREICGVTDPKIEVDHRDGNKLDCRRGNLRCATSLQNSHGFRAKRPPTPGCPQSPYRGVIWDSTGKKWGARIRVNGVDTWLGSYFDERTAALAYDNAARRYFGEFASPNFV